MGKNILGEGNAIIALANTHDRSAIPKLLEIIDKGQNPIHAATAILGPRRFVKEPSEEMVAFIENLQSDHPDVLAEQAAFVKLAKGL